VADDYTAKYQKLSHQQLYDQLMAGDPDQVDSAAAKFSSLRDTVEGVHTSLDTDLEALAQGWNSDSGAEYQRRLGLVSSFAHSLHYDFDSLQGTLTQWSSLLRTAKKHAENPADTDNADQTVKDAATGAAIGGLVGGVPGAAIGGLVGGWFGHNADEEEKQKAHERMIALVAGLAANYDMTDRLPDMVTQPPTDMPLTTGSDPLTFATGPSVTTPGGVSRTGTAGIAPVMSTGGKHVSDVDKLTGGGDPPGAGTDATGVDGGGSYATGDPAGTGAGLLGVDGDQLAAAGGAAGAAAGLGAAVAGLGAGGPGLGGAGGFGAEVAGAERTGAVARPGNLFSGVRGAGVDEGALGINRNPGGAIGRQGAEGEDKERTTWLTEDEMVWGDDQPNAPAVLGESPEE
jgi:uncharacterized protein YukE